jgi:hypothetical protein
MKKQVITKAIFFAVVGLFTIINDAGFLYNLSTLAIVMLVFHILALINMFGAYDSVYYRFGSFFAQISKDEERKKKYESFDDYKEYLEENRTPFNAFNILFYAVIVLITFII